MSQTQVRDRLARVDIDIWKRICPWDEGTELSEFRRETRDPRVWGGAMQIAVCAAIHQVTISVHTGFGAQTFGTGPLWGLRHSTHPAGHYDVLAPDLHEAAGEPSNATARSKDLAKD